MGAQVTSLGRADRLYLGNLDAKRVWGLGRDYVEGMWLMLQQPEPDDYVFATGESHAVREFVELAYTHIGRIIEWRGSAVGEQGVDDATEEVLVEVDPRYFRPTEVDMLLGDSSKAHQKLGWRHRTSFPELVREMVDADIALLKAQNG